MRCRQIRQLFVDFYEGELSEELKRQVELHLEHCSHCQQEFRSFQQTMRVLQEVEPFSPSAAFWNNYLAEVRERIAAKRRNIWLPRLAPVLGGIAAAILVAFLLFTGGGERQKPSFSLDFPEQENIDYLSYLGASAVESVDVVGLLGEKLIPPHEITAMRALYYSADQKMPQEIVRAEEELKLAYETYYISSKGGE